MERKDVIRLHLGKWQRLMLACRESHDLAKVGDSEERTRARKKREADCSELWRKAQITVEDMIKLDEGRPKELTGDLDAMQRYECRWEETDDRRKTEGQLWKLKLAELRYPVEISNILFHLPVAGQGRYMVACRPGVVEPSRAENQKMKRVREDQASDRGDEEVLVATAKLLCVSKYLYIRAD